MINKLSIILLNWHSKEVILECLASIKKVGYLESVIIVDNDSADGSLSLIRKKYSQIKIIELGENRGFAEGNNTGIHYALEEGAKYILILNPDTFLQKSTIGNLIKVLESDGQVGLVGPKILDITGKIWGCGGLLDNKRYTGGLIGLGENDNGQYDEEREVEFISGTAMLVRREVFEKCGLFYSDYFIYYEDVEFCQKAKKLGFKILFIPKSVIIHNESSSMGKNSPAQEYYMARNHLLFVERNAPLRVKLREFIRLPKTLYEHWQKGERWAIRGIGDYFMRRFGRKDYWTKWRI